MTAWKVPAIVMAMALAGCAAPAGQAPTEEPNATRGTPPGTTTFASGSFTAPFGSIDIEATGSGANVSGEMEWSQDAESFSLDLQCSRTTAGGLLLLGGEVTHVAHPEMAQGDRVAIALQPGTPVEAILWNEDGPPADSCGTFLESVPDHIVNDLQPINGDLQLGP